MGYCQFRRSGEPGRLKVFHNTYRSQFRSPHHLQYFEVCAYMAVKLVERFAAEILQNMTLPELMRNAGWMPNSEGKEKI